VAARLRDQLLEAGGDIFGRVVTGPQVQHSETRSIDGCDGAPSAAHPGFVAALAACGGTANRSIHNRHRQVAHRSPRRRSGAGAVRALVRDSSGYRIGEGDKIKVLSR